MRFEKSMKKRIKNGPQILKNRGLGGVWEPLGATLGRKIARTPSWQILVDFGRARIDENLAQMGQDGTKLGPRCRQDGSSWGQNSH